MQANKASLLQTTSSAVVFQKNIFKTKKSNFPNVSPSERKEILEKNLSKQRKIILLTAKIGLGLAIGTGGLLLAIATGKCDKFANNFLSLSCKPIDAIKDFIQKTAKTKKLNQINFDKARKHLHQENTINDKGLVSGAHEIKNLIRTLINNNGNITSIQESKTQNGIWEIIYEIGGKTSNEPKTIYLEEKLSSETIEKLIQLCKKHNNETLEAKLLDFIHNSKTYNKNEMMLSIEKALKEGAIIRSKSLEKSTLEAKERLLALSEELEKLKSNLKKAEQTLKNTQNAIAEMKKKSDFNPKSEEFQALLSKNKEAKNMQIKLGGQLESMNKKYKKQYNHYLHVKSSVNIYGENNGKLYAAFAHYEDNKLIVDSYFPISHGSKMQNEYLEERAKDTSLTLLDFKYLISAKNKHIAQFAKKFLEKLIKIFPEIPKYSACIGIPGGLLAGMATNFELEKLNTEREKEKIKILHIA